MSISFLLGMSAINVAALLFFLRRIMAWKTILRLAIPIDVLFSVLVLIAWGGTMTGTAVAVTTGLMLAITLTCAKRFVALVNKPRTKWKIVKVEVTDE